MSTDSKSGASTTNREWMERAGHHFRAPEELSAEELPKELSRMIHALAEAHVFLLSTDRFTNAELYAKLWRDILPDVCTEDDRAPNSAINWDFWEPEDVEREFPLEPGEECEYPSEEELAWSPIEQPRYPKRRDHLLPKAHQY